MNVLFVCSRNRLRSPTAERVFAECPGVETASAGTSPDAESPVTPELLAWADLIVVMAGVHRRRLSASFARHLRGKRVVCLDIPDDYAFMDPRLIERLNQTMVRHLPPAASAQGATMHRSLDVRERAIAEGRTMTHAAAKTRLARWLK